MKNKVKRLSGVSYLIMGIVSLLMGIILIVNPDFTLTGMCSVVGTVILIEGVIMLILYFARQEYKNHQSSDFMVNVTMILVGIFVLIRKEDISDIFPQFLAIFIVLSGIIKMQQAMDLVGMQDASWFWHFMVGLGIVILSGLVLMMPEADWFTESDRVPLYVCILLVADGILSVVCLIHATARKIVYRKLHPEEFVEAIEDNKK